MNVRWLLSKDKDSVEAIATLKKLRGCIRDEDVQVLMC